MNTPNGENSLPFHESSYKDDHELLNDLSRVLFATYGVDAQNVDGKPVTTVTWSNEYIATEYELVKYNDRADVDVVSKLGFSLVVTETYPDGDTSVTHYYSNPSLPGIPTERLKLTKSQQKDLDQRAVEAITMANGQKAIRPRRDEISPEQKMEELVYILTRGLEILGPEK